MKMKRKYTAIAMMMAMSVMGAKAQDKPLYLDDNQPIEVRVKDALSRMTMEEKEIGRAHV